MKAPAQQASNTTTPDAQQLLVELLLSDAASQDPYALYRRLRRLAPVFVTSSGVVVLTRYDDCDAALRNRALGKADESLGFRLSEVPEDLQRHAMHRFRRTMLFRNPPDHSRLRRLVASTFTPTHIEKLRPAVVSQIERLLDRVGTRRVVDVIAELALPLPVAVIGDLLGVPEQHRAVAAPMIRDLVAPLEPRSTAHDLELAIAAEDSLATYFGELLAAKRRNPGNDLLSRLAVARGEDALDDDECIGSAILLFAAGFETTTNLIGNGLAALLTNPDQLALLRSRPEMTCSAVEELLRYDAPVQTNGRTVLEPTTVAGVDLVPGQVVLILLGAANRDPERFPNPDRLDLTRAGPAALSFGAGIHFCLGAPLARMEAAELFPRLLTRFPGLAAAATPTWRSGLSFRGLTCLPARVG